MALHIFINRLKRDAPEERMSGRALLALGGFADDHDLFRLQGEGDRTGGTQVGLDEIVDLKPGLHFRAIPGNRNFGA